MKYRRRYAKHIVPKILNEPAFYSFQINTSISQIFILIFEPFIKNLLKHKNIIV